MAPVESVINLDLQGEKKSTGLWEAPNTMKIISYQASLP